MEKRNVRSFQLSILGALIIGIGIWIFFQMPTQPAQVLPNLGQAPSFSLIDEQGHVFSSRKLKHRIWIVDFIYTKCKDTCPLITEKMEQLQNLFHNNSKVLFVSLTVDPKYDTPAILKKFSKLHHANLKTWFFLTGARRKIDSIAQNGFKVTDAYNSKTNAFVHSSQFILVDQTGHICGYYDPLWPKDFHKLQMDIQTLLRK
jgi:protein SCO1/2